ncbi:MAG: TlpA family protein disulfide reductase [Gaiellaceae bacterium]
MTARLKLAAQALALLVVAGLFGLLAWKVTHQEGGELVDDVAKGRFPAAPGFRLPRLDADGHLELASLRGRVVLVNFWASWCAPCKRELPRLERAWKANRNPEVVFVGIDTQDFDNPARRAARRYGLTYPLVYDRAGRVLARYGGLPLPRTFVLDRRGLIADYFFGELGDADIRRLLRSGLRPA